MKANGRARLACTEWNEQSLFLSRTGSMWLWYIMTHSDLYSGCVSFRGKEDPRNLAQASGSHLAVFEWPQAIMFPHNVTRWNLWQYVKYIQVYQMQQSYLTGICFAIKRFAIWWEKVQETYKWRILQSSSSWQVFPKSFQYYNLLHQSLASKEVEPNVLTFNTAIAVNRQRLAVVARWKVKAFKHIKLFRYESVVRSHKPRDLCI